MAPTLRSGQVVGMAVGLLTGEHRLVYILKAAVRHLNSVKRHLTFHSEGCAGRRVSRGEVAVAAHRAVTLAAVLHAELADVARVAPFGPDQPLVAAGGRDAVGLCWVSEEAEQPTSGHAIRPSREVVRDNAERKRAGAAARHVARVEGEV